MPALNPSSSLGNPGHRPGYSRLGASAAAVAVGPQTYFASATTTINLAGTGGGYRANAIRVASASNQVRFAAAGSGNALYGGGRNVTASATTGIALRAAAGVGFGRIAIVSASTGFALAGTGYGGQRATLTASARTTFSLAAAGTRSLGAVSVSARTAMKFAATADRAALRSLIVSAATGISLLPQADAVGLNRVISVSATDTVKLSDAIVASQQRNVSASARTGIRFYGNAAVAGSRSVSATTRIVLSPVAAKHVTLIASASTSISLLPSAIKKGRDVAVSAVTSVGMSSDEPASSLLPVGRSSSVVALAGAASGVIGSNEARSGLAFRGLATASVELPGGDVVEGGDSNGGLRAVAYPRYSGEFPASFAETPGGLLLIANGVDPVLRWDGLSGRATTAGVAAPASAMSMGGADVGTLTGLRYAYCRFIDRDGNPSSPGPISNAVNLGRDGLIEDLAIAAGSGIVTIRSTGHGLSASDTVILSDVGGLPLSGEYDVTRIDDDHFALTAARVNGGTWLGGGSWTWGVAEVVYGNVPVPAEDKVVRRQILRNLDGVANCFYVDVDTDDLISPQLTSAKDDEALSAGEPVPIFADDDTPLAARYAPPPSHKSVLASYSGRIFACGEVAVTRGNVAPTTGSATVRGLGTEWPASLAGRFLYVAGATRPYEVAAVDIARQEIILAAPYADQTQPYATYAIRPAPAERRLVYYSEAGKPEAWPPWNSIALPEGNDEIVGMTTRTGYLYFIEKRQIHRFAMQDDPSRGQNFPAINRGCINGRCYVQVENVTYLLDEAGIHAFDGGQATEPISSPIQTLFLADDADGGLAVDWTADTTLWHAAHDAVRNTIRWFCQMRGTDGIFHAICYDYRQRRWWIEEYPSPITSSTTGVVGHRRSLVGTDARRVVALGEGTLDLVAESGPGYGGMVADADPTGLTDIEASFPASLAGVPVAIAAGTGRGQVRIIASNTQTSLEVVEPWGVIPDATSRYQVGGIAWRWRSGWFDYVAEGEQDNPRDIAVSHQPTSAPATLDVQLFYDHSRDPQVWGHSIDQDGVTILQGDPNVTIDLRSRSAGRSGWALQRIAGHSEVYGYGEQHLQILLAGVQAAEPVRVFQITLNGVRSGEDF